MSSADSDPLAKAREEYRKLLNRFKAADADRIRLQWAVDSATCVLNGDGVPEVLSDHPLVALASENLGPAAAIVCENMRMRDAIREAVRWIEVAPGTTSDERLRLIQLLLRSTH
jgi:hypothetical protein